jgi:hypothetical protein
LIATAGARLALIAILDRHRRTQDANRRGVPPAARKGAGALATSLDRVLASAGGPPLIATARGVRIPLARQVLLR